MPRRSVRRSHVAAALAVAVGMAAACGGDVDRPAEGTPADADRAIGDVVVFAAASLIDAFTAIGEAFRAANPGSTVTFNFAASSDLVAQVAEGAPADVVASADEFTMGRLVDGGDASDPIVFATNRATIAVAAGNPEGVTEVADLADPELVVIGCDPAVPCGRYAHQILAGAGVTVELRSLEENVRAVVAKVRLGEADAGIVYATDVASADGAVSGVDLPDGPGVVATYPIAVAAGAPNPAGGAAFVDFVRSDEGQAILRSFGFGAP